MELPVSWPCVDRAPEFEPAPPPTPAAEWPVLDRSSQERTSHPQSVLCHRERGRLGWIEDVCMDGRWLQSVMDRIIMAVKGDILEDKVTQLQRVEEKSDGIDGVGGFDKEGDEALSTPLINF